MTRGEGGRRGVGNELVISSSLQPICTFQSHKSRTVCSQILPQLLCLQNLLGAGVERGAGVLQFCQMFYISRDMLACGRMKEAVGVSASLLDHSSIVCIHPLQNTFSSTVFDQKLVNGSSHGCCPPAVVQDLNESTSLNGSSAGGPGRGGYRQWCCPWQI